MGTAEVAQLLRQGVVRQVTADPATAQDEISIARRHITSATSLVESDPTLAFVALYDAMRKAISAHMRANGFRVTAGKGQHVKTGRYASAALDDLGVDASLAEFDNLRDLRSQSEYDALWVTPVDVQSAIVHATAIVEAVAVDLGLAGNST